MSHAAPPVAQPPIAPDGLKWNMGGGAINTTTGIATMPILFQGQVRAPVA
jgi:hypothetical protein